MRISQESLVVGAEVVPDSIWSTLRSFVRALALEVNYWLEQGPACEHRNKALMSTYGQRCWDCGRVRTLGSGIVRSIWHWETR
jgi:hypothetical protein